MHTLKRSFVFIAIVAILSAVPTKSNAQLAIHGPLSDDTLNVYLSSAAFTTVAMNTSRTFDALETYGYRFVDLQFDYVRNSGSAVTMTCAHSTTASGTYRTIQVLSYSGSTASSATHTWSKTVSGNASWSWRVNLHAYQYLKCTLTVTGGAASDTLTITAIAGVN